jgi:PAS domain S-box-containing protein
VQNLTSLQTYKGWIFVLASAVLIYILLFREFKLLNKALNKQIEAEETIKKERDLLKRINDTIPVGLTLVDSNGNITLANHQAEKILGLKRDKITLRTYNTSDWKITDFHGEPFPVENLPFSLVVKTHQPVFDVQHAIEWKDGKRVLLSINASPLISPGGDFDGMVASIEDISEKVMADNALRTSEQQLKSYINNAGDAIYILEQSTGRIRNCNKRACQDLGYAMDELLKLSASDIEVTLASAEIKTIHRELDPGEVRTIHGTHKRKDGTIFPVEIRLSSLAPVNPEQMISVVRDITERKRAEEALRDSELKYRALFETANDAIFLMDHDVFIDCNPKTVEVFGCTPEQIIGQPPYRFSPDVQPDGRNSREKALEKINAAFTGQPQFFEWQHSRYDGTLFNAEVNLNTLSIAGKDCLVAIVRDITERKRAEEAVRISEDKFAKVFQASPDIIVLTSLNDGRLVDVNERLKDATGYIPEEIIGKRTDELQFWVDPTERDRYIALLMRDGRVRDLEVKFRIKSGEVRDTLISGEIIELQYGKYILGVIRDITDRKRDEDNLRRRAKELATLLKISQEFALTRDLKIILQMTTDRVTELTLLKSSAIYLLEGETLRLWATTPPLPPQFPEELRNASLADHPHIRKAITTGMPVFLPDTATADLTPAERAVTELRSLRSILYIPLIAGTKALGTLIVTTAEEPRILSDAEINFCNTLANIAAMAIDNAILDEEIRKNVEALQQEILNRKRSAVEIKKMNEQLRALAVRLQTIREEERTTIAREIHDELGQMLTGLKYELMWIEKRIDPGQDDMRSKVAEIQVLIDSTIKTVRKISAELRPGILDLGLAAAIEWQAGEFRRRTGIDGRTEINDTDIQLRENTSTQVFRIFQEILTNIMRHANASKVDIILKRFKNDLILIVSDNGKGMHPDIGPDEQSLGLLGMQERTIIFGGTLSITSAVNQGTTVEILIPIEHSKE